MQLKTAKLVMEKYVPNARANINIILLIKHVNFKPVISQTVLIAMEIFVQVAIVITFYLLIKNSVLNNVKLIRLK